jgi:Holliday junction resolvase-like predicted endonuclease
MNFKSQAFNYVCVYYKSMRATLRPIVFTNREIRSRENRDTANDRVDKPATHKKLFNQSLLFCKKASRNSLICRFDLNVMRLLKIGKLLVFFLIRFRELLYNVIYLNSVNC